MRIVIGVLAFLWACVLMVLGTGIAKPATDCYGGSFCREVDYTPLLQSWMLWLTVASILVGAFVAFYGRKER